MTLPLYKYDEDNGIIYKLEGDYYYPQVMTDLAEENLSLSTAGRVKLSFMREHEMELYCTLVAEDRLGEYLREFSGEFQSKVDLISRQMGGDANARAMRPRNCLCTGIREG